MIYTQDTVVVLSWRAKGLFSYLSSLPDGNRAVRADIDAESCDSRVSTSSAIQELTRAGYLRLVTGCDPKTRRASSHYQFTLRQGQFPDPPSGMKPVAASVPNGDDGLWHGVWPLPLRDPRPPSGTPVVYVLYDGEGPRPIYVGKTERFSIRLRRHHFNGKAWTRWVAYPCRDTQHAFETEGRLIDQLRPFQNSEGAAA